MVKYAVLKGLYETERTIGCGGFAKVKLATHLATGEKVAIKIMEKNLLKEDLPRVRLELKALKTFAHKHICKLYQVIETETHFFIVVEYCSGGELFDHIVEKTRLSERESRIFFRQILSAVAYLHTLGYAHRDLKPENVLLDKNQSLKLIDFGLCARPEGGMQSPLQTSCGSPTYAAPELVLGRQYFGPEVDVWAMGVLLYALLAGFLPFDDHSIDALYKKILSGKYIEPSFISKESKQFIKSMLQTDPKKRITVTELLSHSWVTMGIMEPVEVKSENAKRYDEDCVALMAQYNGVTREEMWSHLRRWRYDYNTATYLLLLAKKQRGQPLKLTSAAVRVPIITRSVDRPINAKLKPRLKPLNMNTVDVNLPAVKRSDPATPKTPCTPLSANSVFDYENRNPLSPNLSSPCGNFVEPRRPSSIRKPQKRIRSPNLDGECSPVPTKKAATPGRSTPQTPTTTESKGTPESAETPGSARRVLRSIERSLHKVRHVLTPRKAATEAVPHPVVLTSKDLCNVSTTECDDPEFVINELFKALEKKGIRSERKGFTIRGKMEPDSSQRFGGCSFELEICYIPSIGFSSHNGTPSKSTPKSGSLPRKRSRGQKLNCNKELIELGSNSEVSARSACIGIRRKRLKGDSWCYKKVCEQVLALTATELRKPAESSV